MTPEERREAIDAATLTTPEEQESKELVPNLIWIGAIPIDVELLFGDRETKIATEEGLLGRFHHPHQVIQLNPDQGPGRLKETLVHEILHGVVRHCGYNDVISNGSGQPETEEQLVDRLAPVLLDLLRSNPALVVYLLSHTK